ncbi:Beta-lactamase [Alteripontixanthobacter maritimus]|uniref:Beta-lactamase n=1 Tax=Alteripontixanthobacter maritimus TaxID=2161824 RepID=A0A369Q7T2_9SPHN|nr:serine hydrolase [Alteripontixanthobacter maritimus]RDC60941.1 Beta-lactamase [Alteripontixanthobacter maritimus]
MKFTFKATIAAATAAFGLLAMPAQAQSSMQTPGTTSFEAAFDSTLGTQVRAPQDFVARYDTALEQRIAQLADGSAGRIGVYAIDLASGEEVSIMGDQRFPMASTSKVAIAATFLAGVDAGRWSLTSEYPLLRPVRSAKYSSARAPVRNGNYISARKHLDLMISKSCNSCTDALLRVVGGPEAVNAWMRGAGISEFELTRDIATLVRDDGEFDPASMVDRRDSATPRAMGQLLAGIYQGRLLSANSRSVLINAMKKTTTGKNRMVAALPAYANVAHKTGTLNRTASDIGYFDTTDGRTIAVAIYVTGQSRSLLDEARNKRAARSKRDRRIADISRALYEGFSVRRSGNGRNYANATYGAN